MVPVAVTSILLATALDLHVYLAALNVPSFANPVLLVVHDVVVLSIFFAALFLSTKVGRNLSLLRNLGKYSLFVYLAHPMIDQIFFRFAAVAGISKSTLSTYPLISGILFLVANIVISITLARGFEHFRKIHSLVFPRDFKSFKAALSWR